MIESCIREVIREMIDGGELSPDGSLPGESTEGSAESGAPETATEGDRKP